MDTISNSLDTLKEDIHPLATLNTLLISHHRLLITLLMVATLELAMVTFLARRMTCIINTISFSNKVITFHLPHLITTNLTTLEATSRLRWRPMPELVPLLRLAVLAVLPMGLAATTTMATVAAGTMILVDNTPTCQLVCDPSEDRSRMPVSIVKRPARSVTREGRADDVSSTA